MKTYFVLFAQDIPLYGLVQIEAKNNRHAIAKAKAHWRSIQSGRAAWPFSDAEYGEATNSRIVFISDEDDNDVAVDIDLDQGGGA